MSMEPGQIGTRRAYTGRIINLDVDTVRFPDGSQGEMEMVRHPGASAVVPFLSDPRGADPQLLLIKQYRYAAEVDCAELPGGVVDAGEAPLTAAKRELEEETGYLATDWRKIGQVYANPARQTNSIHIFLAHGLSAQSEQRLDATEEIVAELASIADIKAMIKQGTFSQSLHIASFYMSLEVINQAAQAPDDFNRL